MSVLSIKVPIRKKSGKLFNDPCIYQPTTHLLVSIICMHSSEGRVNEARRGQLTLVSYKLGSIVTLPPHDPTHVSFLLTIPLLTAGRWSTSGLGGGVRHISCHHKNTIGGTGENKTDEQTRTMLGVNSEQKESMQHYMHVRTNASVGY